MHFNDWNARHDRWIAATALRIRLIGEEQAPAEAPAADGTDAEASGRRSARLQGRGEDRGAAAALGASGALSGRVGRVNSAGHAIPASKFTPTPTVRRPRAPPRCLRTAAG